MNILNELECIDLGEPDRVELIGFQYQSITRVGNYFEAAPQAFTLLKQSLWDNELGDDFSGFFIGIEHDNPHEEQVAFNQVRFTAGVTGIIRLLGLDITHIPGGCYARFRYYGKPSNLGLAYHYIFGKWSKTSGYSIDKERAILQTFEKLPNGMREEKV